MTTSSGFGTGGAQAVNRSLSDVGHRHAAGHFFYLKSLKDGESEGWALWLGGRVGTTSHVRSYRFRNENAEVTWDVTTALSFEGRLERQWRKHQVEAALSVPLVAYINRPPYALEGDLLVEALFDRIRYLHLGSWAVAGQLKAFYFDVAYIYAASPRLALRLGMVARSYAFSKPNPLNAFSTGFQVAWQLRLGGGSP